MSDKKNKKSMNYCLQEKGHCPFIPMEKRLKDSQEFLRNHF